MNQFKHLIFIDIETASNRPSFDELPIGLQEMWLKKSLLLKNEEDKSAQELYFEKAGIFAEFGKVICISIGFVHEDQDKVLKARIKSIALENEKELLQTFIETLKKMDQTKVQLCAHNGKEFDFPYLSRRMLINGLSLPAYLELSGKKPWEIQHLDTLQMWKFGDWKNYTSLELLTQVFDIPSPKEDINGSDVNRVYYEQGDLARIAQYCSRDVLATIQVYLKLKGMTIIADEHIEFVS